MYGGKSWDLQPASPEHNTEVCFTVPHPSFIKTPQVTPHHPVCEHKPNVTEHICSLSYLKFTFQTFTLWSSRVTASSRRSGKHIFKQERGIYNLQVLSVRSDSGVKNQRIPKRCSHQKSSHWGCKMLHHQIQCVCRGSSTHTRTRWEQNCRNCY